MNKQTRPSGSRRGESAIATGFPQQNRLLAALPAEELKRLAPSLRHEYLPLGTILYEPADQSSSIYFPDDCIASIVHDLSDGSSAGVATVGNEGAVGIALFANGASMINRAVVQCAGSAYRMPRERLQQEFLHHSALFHVLLRHTQALITQIAQTAVCNRHHSVDRQVCRWLLTYLDRHPSGNLTMTQESIASTLGVRRESVSIAAGRLQKQGAIRYARAQITVLDRSRLEQLTCECYTVVKNSTESLIPIVRPDQPLQNEAR